MLKSCQTPCNHVICNAHLTIHPTVLMAPSAVHSPMITCAVCSKRASTQHVCGRIDHVPRPCVNASVILKALNLYSVRVVMTSASCHTTITFGQACTRGASTLTMYRVMDRLNYVNPPFTHVTCVAHLSRHPLKHIMLTPTVQTHTMRRHMFHSSNKQVI